MRVSIQKRNINEEWPISPSAAAVPSDWLGWPDGKDFAFVLTHDVEWDYGRHKSIDLMNIEKDRGFHSSFNFVPKRYQTDSELLGELRRHGFEVGVHDLFHDGRLFENKDVFAERSREINKYISMWQARGFRAGAMHHNLEWLAELDIEYDSSTFDTDPFEPQPDGVSTIFPFTYRRHEDGKEYIELPYTLPQDYTLFIIMKHRDIDIWKQKIEWIAEKGGMALLITHPDYMSFPGEPRRFDQYPVEMYTQLLDYMTKTFGERAWNALPSEVANHVKRKRKLGEEE